MKYNNKITFKLKGKTNFSSLLSHCIIPVSCHSGQHQTE